MTTLGNIQKLNQFRQTGARGTLIQPIDFPIYAKLNNANENQITSAGDLLVFNAGNDYLPTVREVLSTDTADTLAKTLKGFVVKNLKQSEYIDNNQTVGVALDGCIMLMLTETAINCGQEAFYDTRNEATAGYMEFINLDVDTFKTISAGEINFVIDGGAKNLTALDFSSATTLADVATVLNTALTSVATVAVDGTNNILIKSATTGVTSSVAVSSTNGALFDALKTPLAISVTGNVAGANTGKVLPSTTAVDGLVKCGYALHDAPANTLVKVYIKF